MTDNDVRAVAEKLAFELEFDDIGFVSAEEFEQNEYGLERNAKNIMEDADTVLVLFKKFAPATVFSKGKITASSYYFASHAAYMSAKKLEEELVERGIQAKHTVNIPAIQAAVRYGGCVGEHRLYIHPKFGSTVHIQTILLKNHIRTLYDGEKKECVKCGKCKIACPTGSLLQGKDELCIHENLTHGDIPDFIKQHIYQLFGCEKCQTACPLNECGEVHGREYDICGVLNGEYLGELKALTGKNNARSMRVLNQTIIYAGNEKYREALEIIEALEKHDELKDAAEWTRRKLFDD